MQRVRRLAMTSVMSMTFLSGALIAGSGCRDTTPPPERVSIPPANHSRASRAERVNMRERDEDANAEGRQSTPRQSALSQYTSDRPLPGQEPGPAARGYDDRDDVKPLPPPHHDNEGRPPFDDAPLVNQRPPEQAAFVDAYRHVGSPRISLFVNRTLEGNIIAVNPDDPIVRARWTRERRDGSGAPPKTRSDEAAIYLRPGQYDEVAAKSLDYEAVENIMADWLASNGNVTIIAPSMARQRMTDQQVKELQQGRPVALSEIAQQLGAEVLVQVQAHPTRQTRDGLEVRIVAEAINTKGGQSIGRAVVDVPPPLEKTTINKYTRFLARKLMDDMTQTWQAPPPPDHDAGPEPARVPEPQTAPSTTRP